MSHFERSEKRHMKAIGLFSFVFSFSLILSSLIVGCSGKEGTFFEPPTSTSSGGSTFIALASADTNTRSVVLYDIDGTFNSLLASFRSDIATPRGISLLSTSLLLLSSDNTDRIQQIHLDGVDVGTVELFTTNGLSGAIYDSEIGGTDGDIFVLESNNVERYDTSANRIGNPYISGTIGSCVLSNPRSMTITSDDRLIVANSGGSDEIVVYDVSDPLNPACLSNNAIGNNPYGVVLHSNGNLYITTQTDDQVYEASADGSSPTQITAVTTAVLNNPTSIVELPNGNLAVASSGTDEVWEFDTSGNVVGSQPLIEDPLSLNISDMEVIDLSN